MYCSLFFCCGLAQAAGSAPPIQSLLVAVEELAHILPVADASWLCVSVDEHYVTAPQSPALFKLASPGLFVGQPTGPGPPYISQS
jgi:hypothetical protein